MFPKTEYQPFGPLLATKPKLESRLFKTEIETLKKKCLLNKDNSQR